MNSIRSACHSLASTFLEPGQPSPGLVPLRQQLAQLLLLGRLQELVRPREAVPLWPALPHPELSECCPE
jgi:hypothetical protein